MLSNDINIFIKWLEIRVKNGYEMPSSTQLLSLDAAKSALLKRMLSGKEPFINPPPKNFGYPWYELLENNQAYAYEAWIPDDWSKNFTNYDSIIIDQFPWKILETISDFEWIITYPYGKPFPHTKNLVFSDTRWRLFKEKDKWKIEKA